MKKKGQARSDQQACIEPGVGEKIYDYYNGALNAAEVELVERHIIKCCYCKQTVFDLDLLLMALNDEQVFSACLKCGMQVTQERSPPRTQRFQH